MSKGPGVKKMFDDIAPSYDLMNRVMTMGQDQAWRRFVVEKAGDPGNDWVLDLANYWSPYYLKNNILKRLW